LERVFRTFHLFERVGRRVAGRALLGRVVALLFSGALFFFQNALVRRGNRRVVGLRHKLLVPSIATRCQSCKHKKQNQLHLRGENHEKKKKKKKKKKGQQDEKDSNVHKDSAESSDSTAQQVSAPKPTTTKQEEEKKKKKIRKNQEKPKLNFGTPTKT
jgi:hypothetical protein